MAKKEAKKDAKDNKKDDKKGKGKGKKGEQPPIIQDETLLATTDLEEPEEVQYTDTSYTSASFESLPPVIEEPVVKPKEPKKKGKGDEVAEEVVREGSDLFVWSEEELPVVEEEKKIVEEQPVKKKKGKKGKKEKEKEEIPEFEKPKNWNKMKKKERDAWLEQRILEWRAQKEAEKQAALAGIKEKRAQAARERLEIMQGDNERQEIRRDILAKACALFQKFETQKVRYNNKKQKDAEWQQYLRCDGLPDARVITQMNTYLHLWKNNPNVDDKQLDRRCKEALPMLEMLEEFVANSRQYTAQQAASYNEVRLAIRAQLSQAIELASYHILRNIQINMIMETIKLATYQKEFKGLRLNIWIAIRLPTRKPKPIEPAQEPVELEFPAMRVGVKLPTIIDGTCVCVRAARSLLDLLSEATRTFHLLFEIPNRYEDLFIFNVKEHVEIYNLKKQHDDIRTKFYKEMKEKIKEKEAWLKANIYTKTKADEDELDNLNLMEPPPLPDPRTFIAEQNAIKFQKYLKSCQTRTRAGEVNLRKYRICGGILHLDLLMTPPQPKRGNYDIAITTLQLPKTLQAMKYQVQYRAPSPPPPGVTRTPEEIEAEMKRIEKEYEKLALVNITLPDDVLWVEPPIVCQWQDARNLWTSNYINDYKYNEDKLLVQFRTGVLWPIGLAALRYNNLPYQGWELKPDPHGKGVFIIVNGLCVTVTWLCVGNYVKLKWVTNITTNALKEHFNKKYTVKRMVQIMKDAACDFFPDFDAHNHIEEGTCPKEWVAERHNYHAMAFLSRAYNFQWSRWNVEAGPRNIVMQLREAVDTKREAKFDLVLVTPQKTMVLKCDELSNEFSVDPMIGMEFYPDLFTLNMSYGSVDARRVAFNMKYKLVETVFEMLQELKLSSYS